jgi:MFS transporter, DHA1 family, inner membrane transport protein
METEEQTRVEVSERKARLPIALWALAVSAFAIGTTEFVIMGLLLNVAGDLNVSTSQAGLLVSGYALGVVVGAPLLTALTGRMPRKTVLLSSMVLFIIGNFLCAIAPGYSALMVARVITAFAHGAFFGVGSVVATELVPPDKQATAISIMFTGATLANILGVPGGTFIGQMLGWRSTFWIVTLLGILAVLSTAILVPKVSNNNASSFVRDLRVLTRPQVLLALCMTTLGYGGVFTVFTYIVPILVNITGFSESAVSPILLLFGLGLVIGNMVGGVLADRWLMPSLIGILTMLSVVLAGFTFTSHDKASTLATVFLFGAAAFGTVPGLQLRVVNKAKGAPSLASAFNIAAFNLGNAGGAYLGGVVLDSSLGLIAVTWVGALVTASGIVVTLFSWFLDRRLKVSSL